MTDISSPERSDRWRDANAHIAGAARYLDMMTKVLDAQKKQTFDLLNLAPGMSVIEIGCGMGRDVEAMAVRVGPTGRAVGIDASSELIAQATARTAPLGLPVQFQVGDAHALSFPDNSFDAARVDRVLQHLADPALAVREMARVVRPGGRIAAIEPDWETLAVAGGDNAVSRAVVRHKADVSITHARIGREVRGLLVDAGCRNVMAEMGAVTFGGLALANQVLALRQNLDGAVAQGWVGAADGAAWWSALEARDRSGSFVASMCGMIAGATVA